MAETSFHELAFPRVRENNITGTSTDVLTNAITLDNRNFGKITLIIKNTGANGLRVEIYTLENFNGAIEFNEAIVANLGAGNTVRYFQEKLVAQVTIRVKSFMAGNPTTYSIEAIRKKND